MVIRKFKRIKKAYPLLIIMCLLIVLGDFAGCQTKQNTVQVDDTPLVVGELNPELRDVFAFAIQAKGYPGTKNLVAVTENGDFIELLSLHPDTSERIYLCFAYNRLFFAYDEKDSVGYIDLTQGNGNYTYTTLVEDRSFDRVTGLAVLNNRMFYAYRDEINQVNTIYTINLNNGKQEADLLSEVSTADEEIILEPFDEVSVAINSVQSGLCIMNVVDKTTEVIAKNAMIVKSSNGTLLYADDIMEDDDDYDAEDNDDSFVDLQPFHEYHNNPKKETVDLQMYFYFEYDSIPELIPYKDGYIYCNDSDNNVYYFDGIDNISLKAVNKKKVMGIFDLTLITKDILSISGYEHFEGGALTAYHYNLNTKKSIEKKWDYYFDDVIYIE